MEITWSPLSSSSSSSECSPSDLKLRYQQGFYFQEEDVIQDRFVVHEDQYRDIREGLAKAVISGNIQDLVTAITVRITIRKTYVSFVDLESDIMMNIYIVVKQDPTDTSSVHYSFPVPLSQKIGCLAKLIGVAELKIRVYFWVEYFFFPPNNALCFDWY